MRSARRRGGGRRASARPRPARRRPPPQNRRRGSGERSPRARTLRPSVAADPCNLTDSGPRSERTLQRPGRTMNHASPHWGPILIVDDDAPMRVLVAAILEEAGYATLCVECGEAALLAASQSSLAAAVLDVNLDGLSGYEVCHELR